MKYFLYLFSLIFVGACMKPVGVHNSVLETDIYVEREIGPLLMDIVSPVSRSKVKRPAILWYHGGGFAIGSRKDTIPMMEFFASLGYVAATADYRLTLSGARFPELMDDTREAYKYLRDNADKYNIDKEQIIVGGDSAGAHLALMLGLQDPSVKAIIDIYGTTDLVALHKDFVKNPLMIVLLLLMGTDLEQNSEAWHNASPINFLSADSPPILVMHGVSDHVVPFSQSELLFEKAKKIRARVTFAPVEYSGHGWTLIPKGQTYLRTLPLLAQFLKQETDFKEYSSIE